MCTAAGLFGGANVGCSQMLQRAPCRSERRQRGESSLPSAGHTSAPGRLDTFRCSIQGAVFAFALSWLILGCQVILVSGHLWDNIGKEEGDLWDSTKK